MEPKPEIRFRGEHFGLHSLEKEGAAKGKDIFRVSRTPGFSTEFLVTRPDTEGEEEPLARVKVTEPREHEVHVIQIENVARTTEGTKALLRLFARVEAEARENGKREITTMAYPYVFNFFRRRGFAALQRDEVTKERMEDYRREFTKLVNEDFVDQSGRTIVSRFSPEEAKNWAKKQHWGELIAMRKTLKK